MCAWYGLLRIKWFNTVKCYIDTTRTVVTDIVVSMEDINQAKRPRLTFFPLQVNEVNVMPSYKMDWLSVKFLSEQSHSASTQIKDEIPFWPCCAHDPPGQRSSVVNFWVRTLPDCGVTYVSKWMRKARSCSQRLSSERHLNHILNFISSFYCRAPKHHLWQNIVLLTDILLGGF